MLIGNVPRVFGVFKPERLSKSTISGQGTTRMQVVQTRSYRRVHPMVFRPFGPWKVRLCLSLPVSCLAKLDEELLSWDCSQFQDESVDGLIYKIYVNSRWREKANSKSLVIPEDHR